MKAFAPALPRFFPVPLAERGWLGGIKIFDRFYRTHCNKLRSVLSEIATLSYDDEVCDIQFELIEKLAILINSKFWNLCLVPE